MQKLILVAVISFGIWSWYQGKLPFMSEAGAFDENGNPVVWVFTIKNCGKPCDMGLNRLKQRRVAFEEKQISPNDSADKNVTLWKSMRANGFPLIAAGQEKIVGSGTRAQMVAMLGLNFGDKYLTKTEKRYFKKHFYADGSPRIVMYGADWCPYCKKLRNEFQENSIDFIEIDVDKSGEKEIMTQTMEISGYPSTWVGYTRVNGTSFKAVNAVLKSY